MRRVLIALIVGWPLTVSAQITGTGSIFYGLNPPATCSRGDVFSSYTLGKLYECPAKDTWIEQSVFTGAYADLTGKPTLFDGAYASLSGKPTLGTAAATDATAYATAAQGSTANSALQPAGNGGSLTGLTKAQVGLANVDNTSDANKPVSTATQTALNGKVATGGLAGTATALATPRAINGVNFDGTAPITITAAANTLTGTPVSYALGGIGACAATSATTGTITVNMITPCVTMTPSGNATLNASGGVAGQMLVFSFTTSGANSFTITFGTNFRKTGTLATGVTTARFFTVTFLCLDGTTWTEIARTAVQT